MPYHLRQMCLGDVMVQPRIVTKQMLSRPQDESSLITGIHELPVLLLLSQDDKLTNVKELEEYAREWKSCTTVKLAGSDHTPWIRHPDLVRETVLSWITQ